VFPSAHLRAALPPERFADQVLEIEAELTELHPSWREPARSRLGPGIVGSRGIEDLEIKARVKWLLQKRKHLYDGHDWDVVVKTALGPGGQVKMVAMPIIPRTQHTPETLAAISRVRMAGREAQASLPQIADRLGVSLKRVEALVLDCPEGGNLYHHARRRLAAAVVRPLKAKAPPRKAARRPKQTR